MVHGLNIDVKGEELAKSINARVETLTFLRDHLTPIAAEWRVCRRPRTMSLDERVDGLERSVDQLEVKVDLLEVKVDDGFKRVDERFTELRTHFDVVAESWDSKFAMLYDVVKAHDERFAELKALIQSSNGELRSLIKSVYTSLDRRISALERRPHG